MVVVPVDSSWKMAFNTNRQQKNANLLAQKYQRLKQIKKIRTY
jgi:hypothetical protein